MRGTTVCDYGSSMTFDMGTEGTSQSRRLYRLPLFTGQVDAPARITAAEGCHGRCTILTQCCDFWSKLFSVIAIFSAVSVCTISKCNFLPLNFHVHGMSWCGVVWASFGSVCTVLLATPPPL